VAGAMTENYTDAALRHWRDAEFLWADQRIENADQLFGIAAECALKVALERVSGCRDGAKLSKAYWDHVDKLWDKVPVQNLAHSCLPAVLRQENPFAEWRIDHRYAADGSIDRAAAEDRRRATKRLLGAVQLTGTRRQ